METSFGPDRSSSSAVGREGAGVRSVAACSASGPMARSFTSRSTRVRSKGFPR